MQNWAPGPYPDWYKSYLYYKEVAENYSTSWILKTTQPLDWILKTTQTLEPWKLLKLLNPENYSTSWILKTTQPLESWKLLKLLNPVNYSNSWTTQPLFWVFNPNLSHDTFSGCGFWSSEWLFNLFPLCVRQYDVTITTLTTNSSTSSTSTASITLASTLCPPIWRNYKYRVIKRNCNT